MSRQKIDEAIARHAETETLFDQPYEDKRRVRVSGPFTVESLSPHRTISVEQKKNLTVNFEGLRSAKLVGPDDFGHMIIENLRKAGVQNTIKNERLKFEELKPYAGEWINAEGYYTEADDTRRRAAVSIGPEHGTVGAQLVKEAAKEAVKGVGFDILIVCGFAFDPSVSEEARRYGKLTVLPTRMNPDLAMGDKLLKKTGAGNLFMVFGEPDIEVRRVPSTDASELRTPYSVPGTPPRPEKSVTTSTVAAFRFSRPANQSFHRARLNSIPSGSLPPAGRDGEGFAAARPRPLRPRLRSAPSGSPLSALRSLLPALCSPLFPREPIVPSCSVQFNSLPAPSHLRGGMGRGFRLNCSALRPPP